MGRERERENEDCAFAHQLIFPGLHPICGRGHSTDAVPDVVSHSLERYHAPPTPTYPHSHIHPQVTLMTTLPSLIRWVTSPQPPAPSAHLLQPSLWWLSTRMYDTHTHTHTHTHWHSHLYVYIHMLTHVPSLDSAHQPK